MQDSHFSFWVVFEAGYESVRLSVLEGSLATADNTRRGKQTCNAIPMPLMAYPSTNAGKGKAAASMVYPIT